MEKTFKKIFSESRSSGSNRDITTWGGQSWHSEAWVFIGVEILQPDFTQGHLLAVWQLRAEFKTGHFKILNKHIIQIANTADWFAKAVGSIVLIVEIFERVANWK